MRYQKERAGRLIMKLLVFLIILCAPLLAQRQGPYDCTQSYSSNVITASGATQLVAAPAANQHIRICYVSIFVVQPASAANFGLVSGTGSNCATGQSNLTPQWTGVQSALSQNYIKSVPFGSAWFVPYQNAVCLNLSATVTSAQVEILYDVY